MRRALAAVAVSVAGVALAVPAAATEPEVTPHRPTIVALAQSDPNLSSLVAAVQKAGLVQTLSGGNWTVFAPTNQAFAELLASLGLTSLDQVPADTVKAILFDHVIKGRRVSAQGLASADLLDHNLGTVGGLSLDADRAPLSVNDADIVVADLKASNGRVHVIDKVLVDPDPRPNLVELAVSEPNLSILVTAVQRAGLVETLATSKLTVFAPTNPAFISLLGQLGYTNIEQVPVNTLKAILLDHVVAGELDAVDVAARIGSFRIGTLGGLRLRVTANPLQVNGVDVIATDVEAENGTVHLIDEVLIQHR